MWAGLLGRSLSLIIRIQLSHPGVIHLKSDRLCNVVITTDALMIIFFGVMPILVGVLGNWFMLLCTGGRDLVFPSLNNLRFWLALNAECLLILFYITEENVDIGWAIYFHLSSCLYHTGTSVDVLVTLLYLIGFGSLLGSINFLITDKDTLSLKLIEITFFFQFSIKRIKKLIYFFCLKLYCFSKLFIATCKYWNVLNKFKKINQLIILIFLLLKLFGLKFSVIIKLYCMLFVVFFIIFFFFFFYAWINMNKFFGAVRKGYLDLCLDWMLGYSFFYWQSKKSKIKSNGKSGWNISKILVCMFGMTTVRRSSRSNIEGSFDFDDNRDSSGARNLPPFFKLEKTTIRIRRAIEKIWSQDPLRVPLSENVSSSSSSSSRAVSLESSVDPDIGNMPDVNVVPSASVLSNDDTLRIKSCDDLDARASSFVDTINKVSDCILCGGIKESTSITSVIEKLAGLNARVSDLIDAQRINLDLAKNKIERYESIIMDLKNNMSALLTKRLESGEYLIKLDDNLIGLYQGKKIFILENEQFLAALDGGYVLIYVLDPGICNIIEFQQLFRLWDSTFYDIVYRRINRFINKNLL